MNVTESVFAVEDEVMFSKVQESMDASEEIWRRGCVSVRLLVELDVSVCSVMLVSERIPLTAENKE